MQTLTLRPVAVYRCDFPDKFGLPRQSGLAADLRGRVVFLPPFSSPDYVRGIEGYSHLWLLWQFDRAGQSDSPTVRPPKLGGNTRVGVFASRAPFRPNPVGLSCVRLERVEILTDGTPVLHVAGGDLADNTPVFDIKPYLPYADAVPEAKSGFAKTGGTLRVVCDEMLLEKMPEEKRAALKQVLSFDPRPGYQDDPGRVYKMRYASFDVAFRVDGEVLTVVEIALVSDQGSGTRDQGLGPRDAV